MIGTLLRAAGGAASFTLGSLWPMRWPAFPVAFFDFDMFNEPADALWAEARERCAREARALDAQARELAAQTAIPPQVEDPTVVAARAVLAMVSGDITAAARYLDDLYKWAADQFDQIAGFTEAFGITLPLTSAAEPERPATTLPADPSPADGPALGSLLPEASAGHPNLTVGELEDAAYAVRRHVERINSEIGTEAWTHLAEKLEAAALSK